MVVFKEFYSRWKFVKSFNATFVSLIQRRQELWTLRTFGEIA
jgi:hypothetical protein